MMTQNFWGTAKAILKGTFIAIQSYLKKKKRKEKEKYQINNLTLHLKQLEKKRTKTTSTITIKAKQPPKLVEINKS